jgi:hypothetical protein
MNTSTFLSLWDLQPSLWLADPDPLPPDHLANPPCNRGSGPGLTYHRPHFYFPHIH